MADNTLRIYIDDEFEGLRVDSTLAILVPDISRSRIQKLIHAGAVWVDGRAVKSSTLVNGGQMAEVSLDALPAPAATPQPIDLDVVYEDPHLVVVNKPRGMVTHPAPGSPDGTLVNALLHRYGALSSIGAPLRPGIVHRLDRDTTGLIVAARTDAAHLHLARQIHQRAVSRLYQVICWGAPSFNTARVEAPIGRDTSDRRKMAVHTHGATSEARDAITEFTVRERLDVCTRMEARLLTGRTHQIRVHCRFAGYPVFGDTVYGDDRTQASRHQRLDLLPVAESLGGQALHAWKLTFTHPVSGDTLSFVAEPPDSFRAVLDRLRMPLSE